MNYEYKIMKWNEKKYSDTPKGQWKKGNALLRIIQNEVVDRVFDDIDKAILYGR